MKSHIFTYLVLLALGVMGVATHVRAEGAGSNTVTISVSVFTAPPDVGSLHVTLMPARAVADGAMWRRVGTTPWLADGYTETSIITGTYTLEFKKITGWITPVTQEVVIYKDLTKNATGTYVIVTCTLTYNAGGGGTISGATPQTVDYGGSGTPVTAMPDTGYHFVQWSDGTLTATRTDTNVTTDTTVTATFSINTYTLTYTAGAHGSISGISPQTVNYGGSGTAVTAVPDKNYRFAKWSDGLTANPRTDANVTADISVTATFAIVTQCESSWMLY